MEARRSVWKWMAAAFWAALAMAIGAMAVALFTQHRLRIGPGLEVTARFAFLLFWAGVCRGRFDIALRRRVPAVENPCACVGPLLQELHAPIVQARVLDMRIQAERLAAHPRLPISTR
jgi:hypothetical protein